jgi:outer membrane protein TolC
VRAAQERAATEAELAGAHTQLARAREALGILIGTDGPVDASDDPALELGSGDPAAAAERPDVRAATLRRRAAHAVTRDSFVDYLPLLSGVFQPFFQDPPTLTLPRTGWQAQLVLSIPLFDGGLRYGQRRERSALERRAVAELEETLRQARSEVRIAFGAVKDADQALLAARDAARLAAEAMALAQVAYREGAATNLELIDAERHARDAAVRSALAEDGARQARLDLLAASGRFPRVR